MIRLLYYPVLLGFLLKNYKNKKDVLNPVFITYTIWFIFPLFYDIMCCISEGYHELSFRFFAVVTFFLILFTFFFTLAYRGTKQRNVRMVGFKFPRLDKEKLIAFVFVVNVLYVYSIFRLCKTSSVIMVINKYRLISLTQPQLITKPITILETLSYLIVPMIAHMLVYENKYSKGTRILLTGVYFVVPVVVASKASLLKRLVIFVSCIYATKKKKKPPVFLMIGIVTVLLMFLIISRDHVKVNGGGTSGSLTSYMFGYVFSSIPAFDMLLNGEILVSTAIPGERSFYFWFLLLSKMGFCNRPIDYKDMYTVPVPGGEAYTNVFTGMGPYFIDFGLIGVLVFALLSGILFGFVYKKYRCDSSPFFFITYLVLVYGLVFQYFGDMIFVYIVSTIIDIISIYIVMKVFCDEKEKMVGT